MFSNRPTKAQLREEHEQKINEFLARGGKIQEVKPGVTGLIDGKCASRHIRLGGSRQPRTPLLNVIAAIESRRAGQKIPAAAKKPLPKRQQKVIFDDFGEPVRTVWSDA